MKLNKLYAFLALATVALFTTSCFDDAGTETLYNGNMVEFNAGNLPNATISSNFVRLNSTQTDVVQVQINRVSTNSTGLITVNIEADTKSTAVEGVHYTLASKSIVINPGVFVVNFPVTILTGKISPAERPDLILKIVSAVGADVSAQYNDLTVGIRVVCASTLAGKYSVFWERLQEGNGTGGAAKTFTNTVLNTAKEVTFVVGSGAGNYSVNDISFGMYPGYYGDSRPAGIIGDVCNKLTGPSSNADRYGDKFVINGVVNPNGTFKITWSNGYGDGGTVILTKV